MKTSPDVERWFAEKKLPAEPTIRRVREFNRGARIPGKFAHLEGTGPSARFMRFADPAEAQTRAAELSEIVVAWCSLTAAERGSAKKA